jgi:hypothetical protein
MPDAIWGVGATKDVFIATSVFQAHSNVCIYNIRVSFNWLTRFHWSIGQGSVFQYVFIQEKNCLGRDNVNKAIPSHPISLTGAHFLLHAAWGKATDELRVTYTPPKQKDPFIGFLVQDDAQRAKSEKHFSAYYTCTWSLHKSAAWKMARFSPPRHARSVVKRLEGSFPKFPRQMYVWFAPAHSKKCCSVGIWLSIFVSKLYFQLKF